MKGLMMSLLLLLVVTLIGCSGMGKVSMTRTTTIAATEDHPEIKNEFTFSSFTYGKEVQEGLITDAGEFSAHLGSSTQSPMEQLMGGMVMLENIVRARSGLPPVPQVQVPLRRTGDEIPW